MKRQPARYTLLLSMGLTCAAGLAACGSNHDNNGGGGGGGIVNGAPTVSMTTSAANGVVAGQSFTLTWTSTNTTGGECVATSSDNDPNWDSANAPTSGSAGVTAPTTPGVTVSYTITCTNSKGQGHSTVSELISGSSTSHAAVSGSSSAVVVATGGTFTLSWTSGATNCTASGGDGGSAWSGLVGASGNKTLTASTTAGTYNYLLNCANPDATTSATVFTELVGAVPAPVVVMYTTPTQVTPGAQFQVTWSSSDATACSAGSSAWTSSTATSGSATLTAPTTTGTDTLTLTCAGPNSTSGSGSASVSVVSTTTIAQAAISVANASLAADGNSTTTLSWDSSNATSCSTGDIWNTSTSAQTPAGTTEAISGNQLLGPFSSGTNAVYQYVLACSNDSSTAGSLAFLAVGTPPAPTTTVTTNASDGNVDTGGSADLTWTSTNATNCTAYGSWSGAVPTTGEGSTGALSTVGVYSYALLCSGPEGSSAADASFTVSGTTPPPVGVDCKLGNNTVALVSPAAAATVSGTTTCLGCGVSDQSNVTDSDLSTFATVQVPIDLLNGTESLVVTNNATITPTGGKPAGFLISVPKSILTLSLLQNITVSTLMNGTAVQTAGADASSLLKLDLLTLLGNPAEGYLSFTATLPYNQIELTDGSLISVLEDVDVYAACVGN